MDDRRRLMLRRIDRRWVNLLIIGLAIAVPFMVRGTARDYILNLAILVTIRAVGGVSFNLLGGFAGQVSFGHAAFYGVGAYTFARLIEVVPGVGTIPILLIASIFAGIVSVPIGWVLLRLRGAYFALSMLAYAEVLRLVAQEWRSATGGASGLLFDGPDLSRAGFYWLAIGTLAAAIVATWATMRGKTGAYLLAIREDQDVAASLGIPIHRYKTVAFFESGVIMAAAGSLYAAYFSYLEPDIVFNGLTVSLAVLIITLIGGLGTLWGPVVGSLVLTLTTEASVVFLGEANLLAAGLLLVIVILRMPEGLVGHLKSRWLQRPVKNVLVAVEKEP